MSGVLGRGIFPGFGRSVNFVELVVFIGHVVIIGQVIFVDQFVNGANVSFNYSGLNI